MAEPALPSVEGFERAGLLAWPGIETDWDGNWVRRAANGYTKRANSLQVLDPADGDNAKERLDDAMAWLVARGLKPVVRTTPLQPPELTAVLDAEGWQSIDHSHFFAMPLGPQEADHEGEVLNLLDPTFLSAQQGLQHQDEVAMERMRGLFEAMTVPACGVVLKRAGVVVASGLFAIADGIVVTGNVITDPARRRQGLAAAMMRTGLAWANANGASIAALNVQADNDGAIALYRGLGYSHQYDYHYRIPGTQHG